MLSRSKAGSAGRAACAPTALALLPLLAAVGCAAGEDVVLNVRPTVAQAADAGQTGSAAPSSETESFLVVGGNARLLGGSTALAVDGTVPRTQAPSIETAVASDAVVSAAQDRSVPGPLVLSATNTPAMRTPMGQAAPTPAAPSIGTTLGTPSGLGVSTPIAGTAVSSGLPVSGPSAGAAASVTPGGAAVSTPVATVSVPTVASTMGVAVGGVVRSLTGQTTPVATVRTPVTPTISTPVVSTPTLPTTTPMVTTPTVATPAISTPAVTVPSVTAPTVAAPTPTVNTPAVAVPPVATPVVTTPTVATPVVTAGLNAPLVH